VRVLAAVPLPARVLCPRVHDPAEADASGEGDGPDEAQAACGLYAIWKRKRQ
jgi:hypothetical protein